jgi:hypothetical protein
MRTAALGPVEQYLRLTGKPRSEYRDGVASSKAIPDKLRALIQFALQMLLSSQGVQPYPELTLRISP